MHSTQAGLQDTNIQENVYAEWPETRLVNYEYDWRIVKTDMFT